MAEGRGRGGGGVQPSSASSKTVPKAPKARPPAAVPLDRLLQISVAQHDARMSFDFVKSVVPEIDPYFDEWMADDVTAMYLISEGPTVFHSILKSTFASMTAPIRGKIFSFYKTRLFEEHQKQNFLSPALASLWCDPVSSGAIVPQKLFAPAIQQQLVFGQSNHAFFKAQPPAHHGNPLAFMSQGHSQPFVSPVSGQMQQAAPLSVSAFQSPPAGSAAGEVRPGASAGQHAGVRAVQLGVGAVAVPQIQPVPGGGAGSELSVEQQFDASRTLFHAHGLALSASVKTPWAARADAKVQDVQDPSMPFGFDRVCIHDKIAKAVADRLAKGAIGTHQNVKKVIWPTWSEFDAAGFNTCRVAYYECVLASLTSAIFQDFKDCLDGIARLAACFTFQLSDNDFSELPDAEFMRYCEIYFGPANAVQALQSLSDIRIAGHRDRNHSQKVFVQKFDTVVHKFLFAVNDIVKCHSFWPPADSSSLGSSFDVKTIMTKWSNIFPKQNPSAPTSVQMLQCKDFYELNKKMPFREMVRLLRAKFAAIDMQVLANERAYTTTPIEPDHDQAEPSFVSKPPAHSMPMRGAGRGSSTNVKSNTAPTAPRPSTNTSSFPKRGLTPAADKGIKKKIVPGHQRCATCGHPGNHYGLGSGPNSCPIFGTAFAKPKGYVWKSSADEPSCHVPSAEYKKLLLAKPHIERNWNAARAQSVSHKVGLAAIRASGVDDDGDDHHDDEDDHGNASYAASDDEMSSVNSAEYVSHELAAAHAESGSNVHANVDVAAIQAPHALDAYGYMPQFFGVARFAENDTFRMQCLMDPGGAINIISPMLANRSAVERICSNVAIYTGKRKTGSVSEMVRVVFELMDINGAYTKHSEWFAVSDMGYELLLGRKFCKENGFTSFDSKLKTFSEFSAQVVSTAQVAFLSAHPEFSTARTLFFSRVIPEEGESKNKRKPKAIVAIHHPAAVMNTISASALKSISKFSMLKILEQSTNASNDTTLLLEFCLDRTRDEPHRCMSQAWFAVDKALASGCIVNDELAKQLKLAAAPVMQTTPSSPRAAAALDDSINSRHPVIADGVSNHLIVTLGGAVPSRVNRETEQTEFMHHEAREALAAAERATRFVSKHPVSKYLLKRRAEPPLSEHWRHDHQNFQCNRDFKGERRAQIAALEMEATKAACVGKRMQLKTAISDIQRSTGLQSIEQCFDDLNAEFISAAELAAIRADPEVHNPAQPHEFSPGRYVEIVEANRRPEFVGQRARLHRIHECATLPDTGVAVDNLWEIRVLGKNQGVWLCRQSRMRVLAPIEQQRSRPHPADAAFDDVGIDKSGQPDVDGKLLAHRQFGAEYSAALTARIEALKARFPQVFTTDVSEPCTFEPMKIKLKPNAILPGKARFYRNTPKMREEVRRQIQEQLDWGAVRRCTTPHVSDVLLVKRPHMPGKFRFVVSYVKLNEAIEDEQLIMPDARTQHERLAGKSIFGAFDFSSYYRQIRLHEDSQYLTGFASDEGTFCYCTVPMGIKTACAYAQRVLQEALQDDPVLGPLGVKNYFDDLPFAADTEDEFMHIFEALLNFCVKHKLKVNPDKSVFGVQSITHVGFVVSKDGVAIDPERYRDLSELSAPKSIKKVQSVLGILNYVRNFVPHFSDKAKFLTDKLVAVKSAPAAAKRPRQDKKPPQHTAVNAAAMSAAAVDPGRVAKVKVVPVFSWSAEDQAQFEALKADVLRCPMLACLDYAKPIFIRCDASRFGAGAVLFQYDERGFEHPVCYASRKFLPAERNWSTFAQEASTVVWALERFAEFTQGYHVVVECDHRNISFVKRSAMPQIARWRLRLQDMDFSVRYLSGPNNLCSDGLSRQHVDDDDVGVDFEDVIPECALAPANEEQRKLMLEIAEIAAIRVEYVDSAPINARAAGRRPPQADEPPVAAIAAPAEEDIFDEQLEAVDSSDSEESDSDVEEPLFGPAGELLDEAGQPMTEPQAQPAHLQLPIMDATAEFAAVHNDLVGHGGAFVTLQRALTNGRTWASRAQMIRDIDSFIQSCPCCQKMRKRQSKSLVDRHVISGSPFSQLSIDILKLPNPDVYGNSYIVVIVDNFSHWTSLVAVRNKSAVDAARALMQVVGNFGAPLTLRSDGGAEFVNGIITGVTRMLNISQHVVLPYTPSANGIVERANRAILERLRVMIFSKHLVQHPHHVWADLLPLVQRSINSSFHSAIGTSPAKILFGDNIDLDRCLLTRMPDSAAVDVQTYIGALTHNQRVIMEEADHHQEAVCERVIAKSRASQRQRTKQGSETVLLDAAPKLLLEGSWVLIKPQESYPLHKLAPRWLGPFRVSRFAADSEIVTVFDTVKNKYRRFLKRQVEQFNVSNVADVEGLTTVAETDHFEFPVDAIIGHALIGPNGVGADAVQLPLEFRRASRSKKSFQFLIKWTNYEEPSWISYSTASRLAQFDGYVVNYPGLAML